MCLMFEDLELVEYELVNILFLIQLPFGGGSLHGLCGFNDRKNLKMVFIL